MEIGLEMFFVLAPAAFLVGLLSGRELDRVCMRNDTVAPSS